MRQVGRLHVLVGGQLAEERGAEEIARLAIAGGADMIQLREKLGTTRARIATARALAALCRAAGARLIVNDRVDLVLAADAHGVHLGLEDFPLSLARQILGPDRTIGASAGCPEEAVEAMWAGADYIGAGPVFATASKADAGEPIGIEGLQRIVAAVEIPVIAVGGVTAERVAEVIAAGAHGIAVIKAVTGAADPQEAARVLRSAIDTALALSQSRG